jgi:hypothetical protein
MYINKNPCAVPDFFAHATETTAAGELVKVLRAEFELNQRSGDRKACNCSIAIYF